MVELHTIRYIIGLFLAVYLSLGVKVQADQQPAKAQTLDAHPILVQNYTLSETQKIKLNIYQEVVSNGLKYEDFALLVKIAKCESGIRHTYDDGSLVLGPDKKDTGLFQIRLPIHEAKAAELGLDVFGVEDNIKYAVFLYKKSGIKPWISSKKCWGDKVATPVVKAP